MKKIISILLVAVMGLSVASCSKKEAGISGKSVSTEKITGETYDVKLTYQGVVKAKDSKNYSFLQGGKVDKVFVTEGQQVKKGDKLAMLDTVELKSGASQSAMNSKISGNNLTKTQSTYLNNITNAQISIKTLESSISAYNQSIAAANEGLEALRLTVQTEEGQIEATRQNVEAYEEKLASTKQSVDLAQTNLERMKELYDAGAISKSELENIEVQCADAQAGYKQAEAQMSTYQAQLEQAIAGHEASLANLSSNEAQIESMNSQLFQMQNQLKTARNDLANAQKDMNTDVATQSASLEISKLAEEQAQRAIDNATLTADVDGYVMGVNVKEGEITGAGTPAVMIKSDIKVVSIAVSIDDYPNLQNVKDIMINGTTPGKIETIAQYPDEKTRTYNVDIAFTNDELSMGMITDVDLITAQTSGVFVPMTSVVNIEGVDYVYVYNYETGTVSRTEVELGEVKDDKIQVKNLLSGRIVVSGVKSLNDNDKVVDVSAEKLTFGEDNK